MSKRDLKKYLSSLTKKQLEEQFVDLYEKFSDVKTYYNFVFNPNEEKLEQEAKSKILNEYFPVKSKKAKMRRSTAQKHIKHFVTLGVDPYIIADIMLFNIETAQRYSDKKYIRYSSFYKSMFNSYKQAADFVITNGMAGEYRLRLKAVYEEAIRQQWENINEFERVYDDFE